MQGCGFCDNNYEGHFEVFLASYDCAKSSIDCWMKYFIREVLNERKIRRNDAMCKEFKRRYGGIL